MSPLSHLMMILSDPDKKLKNLKSLIENSHFPSLISKFKIDFVHNFVLIVKLPIFKFFVTHFKTNQMLNFT